MSTHDSTAATLTHIRRVSHYILDFIGVMLKRAQVHDQSKLEEPEKSTFDEYTPLLYKTEYNSPAYKKILAEMRPAIQHHEENNSHHPAYYEAGIEGMNLFDLIEMYCDWHAASERNPNGSFLTSLVINRDRFAMSDQLYRIFVNTAKDTHPEYRVEFEGRRKVVIDGEDL